MTDDGTTYNERGEIVFTTQIRQRPVAGKKRRQNTPKRSKKSIEMKSLAKKEDTEMVVLEQEMANEIVWSQYQYHL